MRQIRVGARFPGLRMGVINKIFFNGAPNPISECECFFKAGWVITPFASMEWYEPLIDPIEATAVKRVKWNSVPI